VERSKKRIKMMGRRKKKKYPESTPSHFPSHLYLHCRVKRERKEGDSKQPLQEKEKGRKKRGKHEDVSSLPIPFSSSSTAQK